MNSVLSVMACLLAGTSPAWAQSAAPTITPGGVVNAADYTPAVAPGMLVAVFGDSMASKVSSVAATPLPTALDGTSVEVNGQAIPLFFVSPKQINAQMPFGITGQVQVRVRTAVGLSTPATVTVVESAPRLFTKTMDGKGEPVLLHNADWSLISAASPARPGEYLILFLTGLGAVSPTIPAGQAGGDNDKYGPLNQVLPGAVTITLGDKQAAILFAGLAPGWVGLYQINLQVPADMFRGTYPLLTRTKDGASQSGVQAPIDGPVGPPLLTGLIVASSSVAGGQSTTGQVTLADIAPEAGVDVQLSSSNSAVRLPATIRIATGQRSATFAIPTTTVSSSQTVTITASLSGVQQAVALVLLQDITGVWSGTASDSSGPGRMTWRLTQTGPTVTGTIFLSTPLGTVVFNGNFSGTVSGQALTFSIDVSRGGIPTLPSCSVTLQGTSTTITNTILMGIYAGTNSCTGPFSNGSFNLTKQ
jgi:uncharacterized protein (TIGR03437 family)